MRLQIITAGVEAHCSRCKHIKPVVIDCAIDSICLGEVSQFACATLCVRAHVCLFGADSMLTVSVLHRVTRGVGGFTIRTISAPQAPMCMVGAGTEITERAHSTFLCAPPGAATVVGNFSLRRGVLQLDTVKTTVKSKVQA